MYGYCSVGVHIYRCQLCLLLHQPVHVQQKGHPVSESVRQGFYRTRSVLYGFYDRRWRHESELYRLYFVLSERTKPMEDACCILVAYRHPDNDFGEYFCRYFFPVGVYHINIKPDRKLVASATTDAYDGGCWFGTVFVVPNQYR